jgi:hypothetical protein
MARHYYRTNVPLPVMILWWGFLGVCVVVLMAYNAIFKAPPTESTGGGAENLGASTFQWGKLEQKYPGQSDIEHGIFFDRMEQKSCTTKGYPGYDSCPGQLYFVNGAPSSPPIETPVETSRKPIRKKSQP